MHSDALRLQQILCNLVGNAVKFSSGLDRPGRVEIRVETAGAGRIPFHGHRQRHRHRPEAIEEDLRALFQAESSTTRRFGGSGLGLSICTRLVRMMKGRMEGTAFPGVAAASWSRSRLPRPTARPRAASQPSTALARPSPTRRLRHPEPARPVAASSSPRTTTSIVASSRDSSPSSGCNATPPRMASRRSSAGGQGQYGLLLTDLHMPGMDGYELTARIRSEEAPGRRTPIVAVTANALRGEKERCIDAGMDDFILKPVQVAALQECSRAGCNRTPSSGLPPAPRRQPGGAPAVFDPQALPGLIGNDAALIAEFLGEYRLSHATPCAASARRAGTATGAGPASSPTA